MLLTSKAIRGLSATSGAQTVLPLRVFLRRHARRASETHHGKATPLPENAAPPNPKSPFYFETGYALFAKRASRPFPPPFLSLPSGSFSDPLTTHSRSRDRRPSVNGEMIRGITNGDDAVLIGENFIGANDGVGAWATKPGGHAALWSRLILHFWALEVEKHMEGKMDTEPDPVEYLQKAYEETITATSSPNEWLGTTTACSALIHHVPADGPNPKPVLYITNLGDCQVMVIRPKDNKVIFKTTEQWHWFDCPRQLGTNSPDIPRENAKLDKIDVQINDIVVAVSDGVIDNLWEHEVCQVISDSVRKWESGEGGEASGDRTAGAGGGMEFVANELVKAAKVIAEDPFAESPYMEKAIDEGLSIEGGKMDDISAVVALCKKREGV